MKKPIIAVDIDDVLAAHAEGFVAFSNEKWGTRLQPEDYDEHWVKMWKIEHEEVERRASEYHKSGTFGRLRHNKDAIPVLLELSKDYELVIITARRKEIQKESLEWINERYPNIFSAVHFAGIWDTTTHMSHTMTKAELCKTIGVSFLIDDQLKHCEGAAAIGIKAVLFGSYTWNRKDELMDGVERCEDWHVVGEYFNGQRRL